MNTCSLSAGIDVVKFISFSVLASFFALIDHTQFDDPFYTLENVIML